MSKKLSTIVIFVLLALVCVGFVLYLRLDMYKKGLKKVEPLIPEGYIQQVNYDTNDPIQKLEGPNNSGMAYRFYAKFTELKPFEGREDKDGSYKGKLIIEGDPLNREIAVWIGVINGNVSLGTFNGSFGSEVTWKNTPVAQLKDKVNMGEVTYIQADYRLPENTKLLPNYVIEAQSVMDTLILEFKNKNFSYQIPNDFMLLVKGIGVVR